MNITYLLYPPNAPEIGNIEQWAACLLPPSWTATPTASDTLLTKVLLFHRLTQLGYDYADLPELAYTAQGKPYLVGCPLYIDLANTDGLALAAVSTQHPLALKVEAFRPISSKALSAYFTHREWLYILRQHLPAAAIVEGWVARTAAERLLNLPTADLPFYQTNFAAPTLQLPQHTLHTARLRLPTRYIGKLVTIQPLSAPIQYTNLTSQVGGVLSIARA